MTIVKSVGVLSVAKVMGCTYALLGFLVGGMFSLIAVVGGAAAAGRGGAAGMLFGVGAIVIIPLFYGVLGFVGGLITGAIYNIVASNVGGIELELGEGYSSRGGRSRRRPVDDYDDEDR